MVRINSIHVALFAFGVVQFGLVSFVVMDAGGDFTGEQNLCERLSAIVPVCISGVLSFVHILCL